MLLSQVIWYVVTVFRTAVYVSVYSVVYMLPVESPDVVFSGNTVRTAVTLDRSTRTDVASAATVCQLLHVS